MAAYLAKKRHEMEKSPEGEDQLVTRGFGGVRDGESKLSNRKLWASLS